MEKKIVFTPVEPNKNLLWLHYKNGLLVLQRFGSKGWEDITNSDQITEAEVRELIKDKANLVGGKVPAEELPSYVDDVIEFNNIQVADAEISSIIGNNLYKNQIRFINNSTTLPDRIGSEDKYPDMFVNFGENTSEDDWTTFEPEQGKIYINTTNNHSYRWSGSQLIDLDKSWSQGIEDLQENTIRTDTSQDFSTERENQALSNIGSGLFVVDLIDGKATLTADQEAKLLSSSGVILRGTVNAGKEVLTKIYFADYQQGDQVSFWAVRNNRYILQCIYTKSTKLFQFLSSGNYIDPNAVSIKPQTLTGAQQAQAFKNLGMTVYVTDSSFLGSTLSAEEIEQVATSKALLFTDTGDLFLLGTLSSSKVTFTRIESNNTVNIITVTKSTGGVSLLNSYNFRDNEALRFVTQNPALTSAQQDVALSNIGLNWIHVSYSLLGTTLDDATYTKLTNAYGIILTDAPSEYYGPSEFICGANNSDGTKVFAGLNLANTSAYIALYSNRNLTTVRYARTYDGAVPYDASKTLTSDQQDVALSNIGLNFVHVDYSVFGTTLSDANFNKIWNAKGLVISGNDSIPMILIRGRANSEQTGFYAFRDSSTMIYMALLASTKKLNLPTSWSFNSGSVIYNATQTLTDTQKQQARTNIGVQSADELLEDADFIAQLKTKLETV